MANLTPITHKQLIDLGFETGKVIQASLEPDEIYDMELTDTHLVVSIPHHKRLVTVRCMQKVDRSSTTRLVFNDYTRVVEALAYYNHPIAVAIVRSSKIDNLTT